MGDSTLEVGDVVTVAAKDESEPTLGLLQAIWKSGSAAPQMQACGLPNSAGFCCCMVRHEGAVQTGGAHAASRQM